MRNLLPEFMRERDEIGELILVTEAPKRDA